MNVSTPSYQPPPPDPMQQEQEAQAQQQQISTLQDKLKGDTSQIMSHYGIISALLGNGASGVGSNTATATK